MSGKRFKENLGMSGILHLVATRKGKVIGERLIKNLIVTAGKAESAQLIGYNLGGTAFRYLAYGTGVGAAAAGDTTLGTETDREEATVTNETTAVTNDSAKFSYTFTIGGTLAITEAGIFNDVSAGDLLARQVFSALNLVATDELTFNWTVQVS